MGFSSLLSSLPSTPLSALFAPNSISSSASIGAKSPRGKLRLLEGGDEDLLEEEEEFLAASAEEGSKVSRVELRIEGMTCGACVNAIESSLSKMPGILSVKVALLAERGIIEYDPAWRGPDGTGWDDDKVLEEISDVGFDGFLLPPSTVSTARISVYGLASPSDFTLVETTLLAIPGVLTTNLLSSVNSASSLSLTTYTSSLVGLRDLVEQIQALGFDAVVSTTSDSTQMDSLKRTREIGEWRRTFWRSLMFAIPVFLFGMVLPMFPAGKAVVGKRIWRGLFVGDLVGFSLTVPVQVWLARRFYINAWRALKHRSSTMDSLVVIATTSAFSYSTLAIVFACFEPLPRPPQTFFDTSTMLVTFVSLGRFLENLAKGKTSAALTDLMALTPSSATIYTDAPTCSVEKKVATELVQVGDYIKIVPGDKIPADGTVVGGSSSVDESMVTGEALSSLKQVGDTVIGGTVNGLGSMNVLVTGAGSDTALAQIVKMVEDAQTTKAPIQEFADRVAGFFVPMVVSLSILTFLSWMLLSYCFLPATSLPMLFKMEDVSYLSSCLKLAISVVVVACPCALGLATPTAVMVGTGVGAKNGILIKGGKALEDMVAVGRVVLDKTGTVTMGKLTVVDLCWVGESELEDQGSPTFTPTLNLPTSYPSLSRSTALSLLAAAEARSEHPLALAVSTHARNLLTSESLSTSATVLDFQSVTGRGVQAHVKQDFNSEILRVGNASFITESISPSTATSSSSTATSSSSTSISSPDLPRSLREFESAHTSLGRTVIFVSIVPSTPSRPASFTSSTTPIPILAVSMADTLKPSSKQAIRALQAMGITVSLLTGDGVETAKAVAKEVGIDEREVWAGVSPKGKAKIVRELGEKMSRGGVAMVGDGINDSPALVAASVGIALSSGTSIAIEAADVVLMRSDLLDVVAALSLGRSIVWKIKSNLLFACVYNVLMIPLAMGFFLPWGLHLHPMMAAGAMAMSSVSVVCGSLTLKWWKRPANSILFSTSNPPPSSSPFSSFSTSNLASSLERAGRGLLPERWSSKRGVVDHEQAGYESVPLVGRGARDEEEAF